MRCQSLRNKKSSRSRNRCDDGSRWRREGMNLFGTIRAPRELVFGSGQRHALGRIARNLGQRALVVTDARLAGDATFKAMVDDLKSAGLEVRVDGSTLPDVPVDSAAQS